MVTAQPSSGAILRSKSAGIGVMRFSETTAYSLKVVTQPALSFAPRQCRPAAAPACQGSGRQCRTTVSPGFTLVTPGPVSMNLGRSLMAEQVRQELVRPLGGGDLVDLRAADRECVAP